MKLFKSKAFIICLAAAIILTLVPTLVAAFGGVDLLRSFAGTLAKPFSMAGAKIAEAVNGFTAVFSDYDELKEENEALKEELEYYKDKEYNEQLLKDQNNWLKDYINFHSSNPSFKLTDARVISREAGNYSEVLTLNKGTAHGIKQKMSVVTADGLLGYVSEVAIDWCKVTTITEAKNSIAVYTERQGAQGILTGDVALREQGLCKMTFLEDSEGVQLGDRVYTSSGEKSIYHPDIYIGEITEIKIDETTGEVIATVTPSVNLKENSDISSVMIVCGYSSEVK